jgi:hypothetical protein
MKENGQIGGWKYIMCYSQIEGARTGVTSNINFTVLAFTADTGTVVLCDVVMKSDKDIKEV